MELWVHILSHLYTPMAPLNPDMTWSQPAVQYCAKELSNMQYLRLVCRKFNKALDDHQFSCQLFLPEDFQNKRVPSLLQWVHRHRTAVRLLMVFAGTPMLEAALSALCFQAPQLHFIYVGNISAGAVHILSCYSGLHSLEIESKADNMHVDLSPLAALPCLNNLVLAKGHFYCEETLVQLTTLRLSDAEVLFANDCFCGSKLVTLNLCGSILEGFDQGLAGCHNLRNLELKMCWFTASDAADKLCLLPVKVARVPTSLSTLTQLTSLLVTLCGQSLAAIQFSWLASLTTLQELGFHGAGADVKLPSELTELTKLERLWLTARAEPDGNLGYMTFQVAWCGMHALRSLFVGPGTYVFNSRLLQVVECGALQEVCFEDVKPDNAESAKFFAVLISRLATNRPDVVCYLDHVRLSEVA